MCLVKNRISKYFYTVIVQFLMKYPKLSIVLASFGFVVFSSWLCTRGLCSHHSQVTYPLFHAESPVRDISNGSMDMLNGLLRLSSISFVMYYAHWCAQSAKLVYEFHRASKKFKGQVSFIAISCWGSSCRSVDFPHFYPQLFLYHTQYEPVQCKGRQKFVDLVHFLQKSTRPLTYISNKVVLEEFLDQGKPSLVAFFNGTNYRDKKYDEFFGAALHTVNTVSSLQFGVITASYLAALLGLRTFGEVVLINSLKAPEIYPQGLSYNCTTLIQWAEQNKIEYVKELDADIMESKTFGELIKSQPSLILFVPMNAKGENKKIIHTYHQVALSYHNCTCSDPEPSPKPTEDTSDDTPLSPHGGCLAHGHVTVCQSLPLRYIHEMQNSCDVCRECYQTCSCADNSFPLRTFSVSRDFTLPRNSCRSLRKNSYQEKNALSVCCFDGKTRRLPALLDVGKSTGPVGERSDTGLNRDEHLRILAEKFERLNKDFSSSSSEDNLGMLDNLLGNLMEIFKPSVSENSTSKVDNSSTESLRDDSHPDLESEVHPPEFGTCDHPGKIRVFAGASCYSNKTVKFYFMDSRKFWNYALAFGVRHQTSPRVALVLVDSQNEAQYVLSEETRLDNATIVDFVMNFTHGSLSRRLRSAPVPNQTCSVDGGCLVEVVSKTFTDLVLDNDKDVFLMYYAPWCGFCKSVKHVIMSLVDHYKYSEHIRIARLNADLNDLPWEYTVESYPSFIFFPARRKDLSVKFPESEERTLENFIKFVETHKTNYVKALRKYATSHVRIHSLQRNLDYLKRQNINLRRRINREIAAKENVEERRLTAERQLGALLSERNDANFDCKSELRKLSAENTQLLREILNARNQLSKYRKIAQRTVEELRKRNWELHSTIVSLEEASSLLGKEPSDDSEIIT